MHLFLRFTVCFALRPFWQCWGCFDIHKLLFSANIHRDLAQRSWVKAYNTAPRSTRGLYNIIKGVSFRAMSLDIFDFRANWHIKHYDKVAGTQIPHFMRDLNQTDADAYARSTDWVLSRGAEASTLIGEFYQMLVRQNGQVSNWDFLGGPGVRDQVSLVLQQVLHQLALGTKRHDPLPYAIHALQDSYSPAHIRRDPVTMEINEIFSYDHENQSPSPVCVSVPVAQGTLTTCTVEPGHKHKDADYKQAGGQDGLSPLAYGAVEAGAELLRCVMEAAVTSSPATNFVAAAKKRVVARYLVTKFQSAKSNQKIHLWQRMNGSYYFKMASARPDASFDKLMGTCNDGETDQLLARVKSQAGR